MWGTCRANEFVLVLACQVRVLGLTCRWACAPGATGALAESPTPWHSPFCAGFASHLYCLSRVHLSWVARHWAFLQAVEGGTKSGWAEPSSARVPEWSQCAWACFSDARRCLIFVLEPSSLKYITCFINSSELSLLSWVCFVLVEFFLGAGSPGARMHPESPVAARLSSLLQPC